MAAIAMNRPLDSISEQDVQALIGAQEPERKTMEYKRDLTIDKGDDKKEFLADVSSFANAVGGHLLIGIDEVAGVPVKLVGIETGDIDKVKGRVENLIRDTLHPQLPHSVLDVESIPLSSLPGRWILILRTRRSHLRPHRVGRYGGFFTRKSGGKDPLDVSELRTAFELSSSTIQRIKTFRGDRLNHIGSGVEMPVALNGALGKVILHLVPFDAFDVASRPDLAPIVNDFEKRKFLVPLGLSTSMVPANPRYNFDGVVGIINIKGSFPMMASYTQIFRSGIVESTDSIAIARFEQKIISGLDFEVRILQAVRRYLDLQKLLKVEPPIFVMLSFLNVAGYRIAHPSFHDLTEELDRGAFLLPEIQIDSFDVDLAQTLKPIFDIVWNAANVACSPNYNASSEFTLPLEER